MAERKYADGGLLQGPSDPDFLAKIEAQLVGCPVLTSADAETLGRDLLQQLNAAESGAING